MREIKEKTVVAPKLSSLIERMDWLFDNDESIDLIVLNTIPLCYYDDEPSFVGGLVHLNPFKGGDGGMRPITIPCYSIEELVRLLFYENPELVLKSPSGSDTNETIYSPNVSVRIKLSMVKAFYDPLHDVFKHIKRGMINE